MRTYDGTMVGGSRKTSPRLTTRGAVTRAHIVVVAADLMYLQGVAATTLDQVTEASGVSKSQLYHYFPTRDSLVAAVIKLQTEKVFALQEPHLEQLASLRGLVMWRDALVAAYRDGKTAYGCLIGSFANELAAQSEDARLLLSAAFQTWKAYLAAGIARMRRDGEIAETTSPEELAVGVVAALQGGYVLAQTAGDVRPFEIALDLAVASVAAHAVPPRKP